MLPSSMGLCRDCRNCRNVSSTFIKLPLSRFVMYRIDLYERRTHVPAIPAIPAQPHAGWKHVFYYPSGRLRYSLGDADSGATGVPQNAAGRMCAGSGAPHRRCPLQSSSQAAGGPRPSMRHPYGGTTAYPVPGRFLLPFGPYGGVLRLGDSPLDGREKAVGDGGSAGRRSHRILADVPLCPLPDGYSGRCHFGSLCYGDPLICRNISVFRKSQKDMQAKQCSPKIGFSKRKNTILPAKYSAFLVENSGIEPLTSCMPCKRSPS